MFLIWLFTILRFLMQKKKEVSLKEYAVKVLLIVNTATGCGFTPQYEGLQDLYEKYQDKGFEILDFPCNQFLNQAPGSEDEIVDFCQSRYGVTFRQFAKINVNGKDESPLYTFLKQQQKGILGSAIKWGCPKSIVHSVIPNLIRNLYTISSVDAESSSA